MILVTGGTGFIGQALIRQLVNSGRSVRILLRPSPASPNLPRGVKVDVAVSSLNNERGLRAALKGVDTIFHLAGAERKGSRSDLEGVDVEGSKMVASVARKSGVERIFFLSHLGANRSSAYPVLKAKAIAEYALLESGMSCTILRCGPVYGPGDQFTTGLLHLLRLSPGIFLVPGDGNSLIQPIWIDDLVTCLITAMDKSATASTIIEIGGGEYIPFLEALKAVMLAGGVRRRIVSIEPAYLRSISLWMEHTFPRFPVSIFWLDYLAADRTCALDTLPRMFGLIPARFHQSLDYLRPSRNTPLGMPTGTKSTL